MNFFSSSSASKAGDKPTARTRAAQPIDALAPEPIPTWPDYYRQHLASNPPPPNRSVVNHLAANVAPFAASADTNRRVKLWQGDITKLRVGAVVNAANSGMWAGGGICGAIHSAAGSELEAECERWVKENGKVPTGQTLVTGAYRLPADFVFHAVGPTDGSWEKLRSCYLSCLDLLVQHSCRSIAFCCVSTGIFGFPNLEAAVCAMQTVRQWLDESEAHRLAVDCILFCVFLAKDKDLYERHMPLFFPLTAEELDGSTTSTAADGGAADSEAVEEGEEKQKESADLQAVQGQQTNGHENGEVMEVSRGDTVWERADQSISANHSCEAAPQEQPHEPTEANDEQRKAMTANLLARNIQFSRAPPPSEGAPHPHTNRRACVLFFSSTSALTPHVACLLANSQQGEHVQALWSTSHKDGPLVDETAAEVMQELSVDESDDPITHYAQLAGMVAAWRIDCVVAVDAEAARQAKALVADSGVPVVLHVMADPQAGGGQSDAAHLQVRYRQAFNQVQAFVNDLPAVLERHL